MESLAIDIIDRARRRVRPNRSIHLFLAIDFGFLPRINVLLPVLACGEPTFTPIYHYLFSIHGHIVKITSS